jgi:hypothetical protein
MGNRPRPAEMGPPPCLALRRGLMASPIRCRPTESMQDKEQGHGSHCQRFVEGVVAGWRRHPVWAASSPSLLPAAAATSISRVKICSNPSTICSSQAKVEGAARRIQHRARGTAWWRLERGAGGVLLSQSLCGSVLRRAALLLPAMLATGTSTDEEAASAAEGGRPPCRKAPHRAARHRRKGPPA